MIGADSGRHLYSLCYFQVEEGDVVEIGSWQGRSASFLARAVENSGNGNFYAVDHCKGNVGKEPNYIIEKDDMSDLKAGFLNNIERTGLSSTVNLLDMKIEDAAMVLEISKFASSLLMVIMQEKVSLKPLMLSWKKRNMVVSCLTKIHLS